MELPRLDGTDPLLVEPIVDIDRRRSVTDPVTGRSVSCREVAGGFAGTPARFACYLPDPADFTGCFFHHTYPTNTVAELVDDATQAVALAAADVVFAVTHGAYAVSTNNGGGLHAAPDGIGAYRVNAAAARASRLVAAEVYGSIERPRGYLYGASGGAYQTLGAMESTERVWDGAVAMVPGTTNAIPSNQAAQVLGLRVLHDVLPRIADAVAPGGSGDPYLGLSAEQAEVLRQITRLGFPVRGWWQHARLTGGSFTAVAPGVRMLDPTYVDDFWTTPGYEGADPASPVRDGWDPDDTDRSWELALQYYFRHVVPADRQPGWEQFRDADGTPRHPQRPRPVGPVLARATAGTDLRGRFDGKLIVLASTMDVEAFPWMADWYRRCAAEAHGADLDERFRLWFTDNADHDTPKDRAATAHVVGYSGSLRQALLDLDRWVVDGIAPPLSSGYEIGPDNEIVLAESAVGRRGVQPLVGLAVDGGVRVDVVAGSSVELVVHAAAPPGAGQVVVVEWDVEGTGEFVLGDTVVPAAEVTASRTHRYERPGTYFATVRVGSQRDGTTDDAFTVVSNLARVRVVVT